MATTLRRDHAIVVACLSRLDKRHDDGRISPKDIVDVETSEAIERINDSVVELRTELHDGLASVRTELHDGIVSVRAEIREGVAEAKRHASVLFESQQDTNRLLAEGFATLNASLDKIDTRRR